MCVGMCVSVCVGVCVCTCVHNVVPVYMEWSAHVCTWVGVFVFTVFLINLVHVVCDDHAFKDDRLFYRFRRDDGTYQGPPDPPVVAKGQRLYSR